VGRTCSRCGLIGKHVSKPRRQEGNIRTGNEELQICTLRLIVLDCLGGQDMLRSGGM
jgi:hypothetical protein